MFEHYYQELLNFVSRAMGDRDQASDVVQETYARVIAMSGRGEPASASLAETRIREPRALLYRTAKNILVDQHRRAKVRQHDDVDALPEEALKAPDCLQPERRCEARQNAERLLQAIDGLPPRCRQAFVLYKLEGMAQADIAREMGISLNMVEKHIISAMVACRQAMSDRVDLPLAG